MITALAPAQSRIRGLFPGFIVSVLVAATAQFLSEHYGAPAMLLALLLGLSLNFLAEDGTRTAAGIAVTSRTVLRLGVALLGARVSVEMLGDLGAGLIALVAGGVGATILFGLLLARVFGRGWRFGLQNENFAPDLITQEITPLDREGRGVVALSLPRAPDTTLPIKANVTLAIAEPGGRESRAAGGFGGVCGGACLFVHRHTTAQ